ncbi:MAG: AAA family ATPase [Deltaproteobacteria bacterium]|nr:AAA family ATPase [Deltaproteobacteria bacterium]
MRAERTIWSVGGGKGGIGKSVATANIGCALARMGKKVILVDADLGGANLHTYFGIKYPPRGLDDFLKGRISTLEDAAVETQVKDLRLISGGGEFLGIANPAYAQKQKLISHIKKLGADYIIVDLGAGSSYNVLDFFAISNEGIVVLVPEPAAIQNAYVFLKSFVYRRLSRLFSEDKRISEMIKEATDARSPNSVKSFSDLCGNLAAEDRDAASAALAEIKSYRPKLLLNMAASKDDLKVVDAFRGACATFLSLDTSYIGTLYSRGIIKSAARRMRPFMLDGDAKEARADMDEIISALIESSEDEGKAHEEKQGPGPAASAPAGHEAGGQEVFGFNDNVSHSGVVYHVQTEVQGGDGPQVETIVYHGGRIFFSKKTPLDKSAKDGNGIREFALRQHRAAMAAIRMDKITIKV